MKGEKNSEIRRRNCREVVGGKDIMGQDLALVALCYEGRRRAVTETAKTLADPRGMRRRSGDGLAAGAAEGGGASGTRRRKRQGGNRSEAIGAVEVVAPMVPF